jgi:predicted amidohydrolase YtcJ
MKIRELVFRACWFHLCFAACAPAFASNADAIYFGGPIVTDDDRNPSAEAVAVKAGKIVAVGARAVVEKAQKGPKTRMIDLGGATMIPGFIDAHGHMWGVGVQAVVANLLPPPDGGVSSIALVFGTPPHMH